MLAAERAVRHDVEGEESQVIGLVDVVHANHEISGCQMSSFRYYIAIQGENSKAFNFTSRLAQYLKSHNGRK